MAETRTPDFVDEVLTLDVSDRFNSFTTKQLRTLEIYDDLSIKLGESEFFNTNVRLRVGGSGEHLEYAGEDALDLMSMRFRQL